MRGSTQVDFSKFLRAAEDTESLRHRTKIGRIDGIAAPDAIAAPESKLDLRTTYLTAKTTIAPTTTNKMCTERQIKNAWKKNNVRLPMHFPVQGQWWSRSSTHT